MELTELKKYNKVNQCESLEELAEIIRSFAINGFIKGRTRSFNSEKMAKICEEYTFMRHNYLTREFGIRQQAMMLLFYGDNY